MNFVILHCCARDSVVIPGGPSVTPESIRFNPSFGVLSSQHKSFGLDLTDLRRHRFIARRLLRGDVPQDSTTDCVPAGARGESKTSCSTPLSAPTPTTVCPYAQRHVRRILNVSSACSMKAACSPPGPSRHWIHPNRARRDSPAV